MIKVAQHIERLLRQHDCVIVPGLGGFIAQDCAATYVEDECCFLPPYRSVTFNPCLTMNDGLFVHEVAEEHHLSYEDALAAISLAINDIHKQIITKGKYKIDGIGTLENVNAKSYEFTPLPYGIEAPDLYGLDSYYFAPIEQAAEEDETVVESAGNTSIQPEAEADNERFTFSIPMSVIRYAAVAAVSAVFFFICIAPLNTAIHQSRSEANFFHAFWTLIAPQAPETQQVNATQAAVKPVVEELHPADIQVAEEKTAQIESAEQGTATKQIAEQETAAKETAAKETAAKETAKETAEPKLPVETKQAEGAYTISVAAAIPIAGAEQMAAKMKSNGLEKARVVKGKMMRVVYGSYATEAEAKAELAKLRGTDPVFDQSWVLKLQ